MSKSKEQTFSLHLDAVMTEGTDKVKLNIDKKMHCNVMFIANVFRGIMEDDDEIKAAIILALSSFVDDNLKTSSESMMNQILSKVTAQA